MMGWLARRLQAWSASPVPPRSRWRRLGRGWARLLLFVGRQLVQDKCLQQASALAFKTVLSLVPLFVVSFFLFRSVGGLRDIGDRVETFIFRGLNVDRLVIVADEGPTSRRILSVRDEINTRLDEVYRNLDVSAISIVGLLFLAVASTSLLRQMDEALNQVWKAPTRRSRWVRLTTYWTVITAGPIVLGASFYLADRVGRGLGQGRVYALLERVVALALPVAATWLVLYLAYVLIPATAVHRRSAAVGALVAALMLAAAEAAFGWYVYKFVPYSKTYGALALLPIFLVWLHLLWVIVLFGAELAYSLQTVVVLGAGAATAGLGLAKGEMLAVNLMVVVTDRFGRSGRPFSISQLARRLHAAEQEVREVARLLVGRSLLNRIASRRERYQVARAPETIAVAEVLGAVGDRFRQPLPDRPTDPGTDRLRDLYQRLDQAARSAIGAATLADLIAPAGERPPAGHK